MLQFIRHLGPEVLDAILIAVLILPLVYGALRGIKNILINFLCYALAVLVAFTHVGNPLKALISDKILVVDKFLPAGSNSVVAMMANTYSNLLASVALFLTIYIFTLLLMTLVKYIINRKRNWEPLNKSVVGRIFAALFIFLYNGITVIALFLTINTNAIGVKFLEEESYVAKHIVKFSQDMLNKIEEDFDEKLVLKLRQGNILYNVDGEKKANERVISFKEYNAANKRLEESVELMITKNYLASLEDTKIETADLQENMKNIIKDLDALAIISMKYSEKNDKVQAKFANAVNEVMRAINKVVKTENNGIDGVELGLQEASLIRLNLKDAGASEQTIQYFDEAVKTQ